MELSAGKINYILTNIYYLVSGQLVGLLIGAGLVKVIGFIGPFIAFGKILLFNFYHIIYIGAFFLILAFV